MSKEFKAMIEAERAGIAKRHEEVAAKMSEDHSLESTLRHLADWGEATIMTIGRLSVWLGDEYPKDREGILRAVRETTQEVVVGGDRFAELIRESPSLAMGLVVNDSCEEIASYIVTQIEKSQKRLAV